MQGQGPQLKALRAELARRPAVIASRRFHEALYGAHHDASGWHEGIGSGDVLAFMGSYFVAANATLIVAGRFDADAVEALIRTTFAKARRGPAPIRTAAAVHGAKAVTLAVADPQASQVNLLLGYPLPRPIDGNHAARLVLAELLEIRVRAVRERLGATYGLHVTLDGRGGPGAFVIGGPLEAGRAGEALALIRQDLDALRTGEGFEADFVLARRAVLRRLVARAGTAREAARVLAFNVANDLPDDFHEQSISRVAALSLSQIRDLIATDLRVEAEILMLRGTRPNVEAASTANELKPTWVD